MHTTLRGCGVWLRCAWLAALFATAVCHDYEQQDIGSGIPQFPTATVVGFERSNVVVHESNRTVEVCAVVYEPFLEGLPEIFNVSIFTENGRAKAGEDYQSVSETVGPFNDTHRRLCVRVPLIDDMFCESNPYPEDFTAVMTTNNANVTVTPQRIGIVVEDRLERECEDVCLGFEKSVYTTIEEIGYILVCVKVLCPEEVQREVFVNVSTDGLTAKANRDFIPLKDVTVGPLGPYSMRRCIPIHIINDGECERRSERFYVTLESEETLVSFPNNNAQVVIDGTTEYDDCASVRVGFLQAFYTVREGDSLTVCIGAFEPQTFGANFNLTVNTEDSTAVGGSDYVPIEDLLIGPFNQGSRLHCFSVEVIDDNSCGDDPTPPLFLITLSSYADLVILNPVSTRIYIYDAVECTQVRVGLAITTFSVQEDERVATTCASVFSPPVLGREVEALVNTRDGTAEQGDDYLPVVNQRITFSEDARYVCFNTTIMNDGSCEALEFFTIKLSSSAPRVLAAPSTGYVIIRDPPLCTGVQVALQRQTYSTYEGAGSVEVCVTIRVPGFPQTQPFNLTVSTQDGSASAPSDYTALSNVVVGPFNATNSEACFAISIMEDGVCEGEVGSDGVPAVEVFNAVVRSEEGSGVEVIASGSIASITIEDSAICIPVVLGFEEISYTARESDGSVELCVNLTDPAVLRRDVTLNVHTLPGTATAESDYVTLSQSLGPFSDEERRLCVTLEVSADGRCDGSPSETLTVRLNSSDPNVTLSPANSSVVILDSPQCTPGTVTFEQSEFISSEELGWAVLCASFSGPPSTAAFSLVVSTYDISASAGEDYVSVSQNLTFGPATTQNCLLVLLVQDAVCESTMTESFGVKLTNSESGSTVQDTALVVIYDAAECITVTVQFEEVVYSLQESRGRVQVCAEILRPAVAEREFFLMVTSADRDAIAGEDYTSLQEEPLGPFSQSQHRHCLGVVVADDSLCEEPEESFTLSLTADDDFIDISRGSVTVYIEDVEEVECVQVSCGFENTAYIVQETVGQVEACVSIPTSQVLQFDFNLTILTVDGSATGGMDFLTINELLMFAPGQQRQCVLITIVNDQECEDRPNEAFTVVVRGEDQRAVLQPSTLTITIDDSGQFISLADPDCFPLEIYFTGDTPRVGLDSVEIEVATRGRGLPQTISCDLNNNKGHLVQTINCTGGAAIFAGIRQRGYHTVRATVLTGSDSATAEIRVRIDSDPRACSAHLINRGLTFAAGGIATAQFVGVGPFESFRCTVNGETVSNPCTSPVQLSGLQSKYSPKYTLRVTPMGTNCTTVKKLRKDFFYVEPYLNS
jgi:hypothetical protein